MTKIWIFPLVAAGSLDAATLLWEDNFNTADTANFDGAPLAGRLSGTLATTVVARSEKIVHGISGNQLDFKKASGGPGRIRFENAGGGVYDWASGTTGTTITSGGGLRISFDWTPSTSDKNWVAFNIGIDLSQPTQLVNYSETDSGILFRNDGSAGAVFDNGTGTGTLSSTSSLTPRHVVIDYLFDSFADGTAVTMNASVDGTVVYNGSAGVWDNGGALYMQLENNGGGQLVDNFSISTVPEPSTSALLSLSGLALILRRRK